MKEIQLNGYVTLVDDEDFERISKIKWSTYKVENTVYVIAKPWDKLNKKYLTFRLHRVIMNCTDPNVEIDHIDGNGLNNQKYNLRLATHSQNMMNRRMQKNNTTGYRGVFKNNQGMRYRALIRFNKKLIWLGSYLTPQEASAVYEAKAKELFGSFYTTRSNK